MHPRTLDDHRWLYLRARALVARDFRQPLTLASVGRALAISPRQLQRLYAQFDRRSFSEDLAARRMTLAARLLENDDASIGEIAISAGYRHGSHFARTFQAHHGVTPSAFRRRARSAAVAAQRSE